MDPLEHRLRPYAGYADPALRVGLGLTILLAGLHKLVEPAAWAVYAAPWFVALWPLPMPLTMVAFGVTELPVGLALLADRYVTLAASIVAVSMLGVVGNFLTVAATSGEFVDVLIRDFGLFVLASGVALRAAGDDV